MNSYIKKIKRGSARPLGATKTEGGFNFAVYATQPVTLVIAECSSPLNVTKIALDPRTNRTGTIWHLFIETDVDRLLYGYLINETLLVDPYAQFLKTGNVYRENNWRKNELLAVAGDYLPFDWEGIQNPNIPLERLIIYEMHVRGFTMDTESHSVSCGTYKGLIDKIPYLKDMGINACELLPVLEFDELECPFIHPKTHEKLTNYWGYSPLNFFQPMLRYSSTSDPFLAANEFKEMVKMLHKNGIEVILDVVFNHTGEGNTEGPTLSYKGFSKEDYYLIDKNGEYLNYSGCGNTLNCNNPLVQDLIISALASWVTHYHIDGFRFDLASVFARGRTGEPIASPPLLERITNDPLFRSCKLIAEPWDAAGLHQLGSFFSTAWRGDQHWIEWNDDFRTVVRKFIRGDDGFQGRFATKLCGSEDIYGDGGHPTNSLNFVTCHDGFTLRDLVSYNEKHNEENGEDNRDGASNNDSSDYGKWPNVDFLREKQMKNFLVALFVSMGIPMLMMGDEYGHTKNGNNNSWCHDSMLNWFSWKKNASKQALQTFTKKLIHFRKENSHFQKMKFLRNTDVVWHGEKPNSPLWNTQQHLVAYTLIDEKNTKDIFIAFNTNGKDREIELPFSRNGSWKLIVDTGLSAPHDFSNSKVDIISSRYTLASHSVIILQ